jgi:hypothetical protein
MTIYLTKEVSVDTEVEVDVEVELDEVIDGNEDEVLDYLLNSGYREFVQSTVGDDLLVDADFVSKVKSKHDLLTHEEAKEMFHVEQPVIVPEPQRSGFYMTDEIAFRASEPGMIADLFKLHDGQVAVRIRKNYGGGYFVADPVTVGRLLALLPPPVEETL